MNVERFHGIYASTVCPMHPDGGIDEPSLERHLADVTAAQGLRGLLVNGHAGENFALGRAEKYAVVAAARAVTAGRELLIVAGVNAEDSREAAREAAEARAAGADAVMVFPPFSWAQGQDDELALRHHRLIVEATDALPLFLYQAPVASRGMAYPPAVLGRLLLGLGPELVGIKEGSWETAAYEAHRRLTKRLRPEVAVMASGDEHLLTCFVLGSEGSLVSLAALAPELVLALDEAVRRGDLRAARAAHERVYPLARAIYGTPPGGHATARLKACLHLLGRLPSPACRPPMGPLPEAELQELRAAMREAGLA